MDDYSGVYIIKNREALNNKDNLYQLTEEALDDEGKCNENLIGFYFKNNKQYYINFSKKIYNIKVHGFDLTNLVSSDNKIFEYLNVEQYVSENDYIDNISNINNDDLLIHVFHKNHYYKNKKSWYEICDVLVYDKNTNTKYLIFIKYKYLMSSSEVFWQSSFVFKKFEKGDIKEEELMKLLEKVNFPNEYRNMDFFQNFEYVNLILPEKGNTNTENLTHIINLWKNDKMAEQMKIIIPETAEYNGGTKIINIPNN